MKILHTEASCGWGGQEIRILEESSGLMERGFDISIACPQDSRIFEEASRYGVPAYPLPIGKKRLEGLVSLKSWISHHQPDIINTHSSTDSWLTGLAVKTAKAIPSIVRTRHISAPIANNFASRWLYGRSARHVVTTGEALRSTLITGLGLRADQVTSVPTGIDTTRFSPKNKSEIRAQLGLAQDTHFIGIVATLRSWKGHQYLLEAFAALAPTNWKLLIVGEGPRQEPIKQQIEHLGLTSKVLMVGQQTNPEAWLNALDIFCLPSYANEGVPQSVLQAMLCELPIVTTPVGAILEAVEHEKTAIIVPPNTSRAIQDALSRLMLDSELATRLGKAARQEALQRFSKESMLDAMSSIFLRAAPRRNNNVAAPNAEAPR